ncbi:MAG: dockerin type I repeat-containing protein [Hominenteromicrobium sp.]
MKKTVWSVGFAVFAVVLAVCVLAGYTEPAAPESELLADGVSDSAVVHFFEPCGNTELLAYTDRDVTHICSADGSRSCTAAVPGHFAFLRGETVTVLSLQPEAVTVQSFYAADLEEAGLFRLSVAGDDVRFAEADAFGRLYLCLYSEPSEILIFDAAGSYTGSLLYAEAVCGMQVLDNLLFVQFSACGERIELDAGFPQTGTVSFSYAASARPYRMLDAGTYIDTEGRIRSLDGTALLDTGVNPLGVHLTALGNGCAVWASDTSTVSLAALDGGGSASFAAGGKLKALTASAAVICNDRALYRISGSIFAPPSSQPAASASPSPTSPPDSGTLEFGEGFLFAPEGMTCAKLCSTLSSREVQVYTQTMASASGKLRTGMTALIDGTPYTIVIRGDINGSGTVNTADLRLFQQYLADDETLSSAALLAADLNTDGAADAADLVLLSARIPA